MKKLSAVPVPAEGLTVKRFETETIIVTGSGEELHKQDETGTNVWTTIDRKRALDHILDLICGEYEIVRERAQTDLLIFMTALEE